jgi:hypothetical protein
MEWVRPAINYLLRDFRKYLIQKKIDQHYQLQELAEKYSSFTAGNSNNNNSKSISWIESNILQGEGISDYRKITIDLMLASYLVNVKNYDYNTAYDTIVRWLDKCADKRPLKFNVNYKIRCALNRVSNKKNEA